MEGGIDTPSPTRICPPGEGQGSLPGSSAKGAAPGNFQLRPRPARWRAPWRWGWRWACTTCFAFCGCASPGGLWAASWTWVFWLLVTAPVRPTVAGDRAGTFWWPPRAEAAPTFVAGKLTQPLGPQAGLSFRRPFGPLAAAAHPSGHRSLAICKKNKKIAKITFITSGNGIE